jgi:hypothetical protein
VPVAAEAGFTPAAAGSVVAAADERRGRATIRADRRSDDGGVDRMATE